MLFEKEKYYKHIGTLEKMVNFMYAIYILIFGILGLILYKGTGLILGILLGILISTAVTLKVKIQIQEMKMKFDIYNKLIGKNDIM